MKRLYFVLACLSGIAIGVSIENICAMRATAGALTKARQAGYVAGLADGERQVKLFRDTCSTFGSGDITFIVCKGGAQ
jgi:hypothetical protein